MQLLDGVRYNLRGLWMGLRNAKLFFWGMLRFLLLLGITILLVGLVLVYHDDILAVLWTRPESVWIVWLWHLLSWILTLMLVALSVLFSYLISQILFSVLIMDTMSRITERLTTGTVKEGAPLPFFALFFFLIKQEIPRALAPVGASCLLILLGWFTPLGPLVVLLSSVLAALFLSWDNTDLTPARRSVPFGERWRFLLRSLPFHLGFGLPFLVPGLNILVLAFAPVGATLYYIEKIPVDRSPDSAGKAP